MLFGKRQGSFQKAPMLIQAGTWLLLEACLSSEHYQRLSVSRPVSDCAGVPCLVRGSSSLHLSPSRQNCLSYHPCPATGPCYKWRTGLNISEYDPQHIVKAEKAHPIGAPQYKLRIIILQLQQGWQPALIHWAPTMYQAQCYVLHVHFLWSLGNCKGKLMLDCNS